MIAHAHQTRGCSPESTQNVQHWHAVTTVARHEKSTLAGLIQHGIDAFLPTYESVRAWRNRQKVSVVSPLFPTYLFVRITHQERLRVLRTPGVRQLVGNSKGPAIIPMSEVETLRKAVSERKVQPFDGLVEGKKVRVRTGPLRGMEGYLVRRSSEWRFVVKVQLINQHASIEVDESSLELLDEKDDVRELRAG